MVKGNDLTARHQEAGDILFRFRDRDWDQIRQSLGLDAAVLDAQRFRRSGSTMRFSNTTRIDTSKLETSEVVVLNLRSVLQDAASNCRLDMTRRARLMPAQKIRKALTAARAQSNTVRAGCEAIIRSGLLWKFELEGTVSGAQLQLTLEETVVPALSEIAAHFTNQLEALKPSEYQPKRNRNASKPGQTRFYAEILRVWNELAVACPELKAEQRMKFFLAVAVPVMGSNVATRAAIRSWLARHGGS
jgi:hypothetical protein